MDEQLESNETITSDDKLWAALGYPIPIVAIIALLMEDKKNRSFIRFHAIQSIIFNLALFVVITIIGTVTLGIGFLCFLPAWLVTLWPAYDSYQGNRTEIQIITNFINNQDWV